MTTDVDTTPATTLNEASAPTTMAGRLAAGLAGAVALTVLNESARRVWPKAPRLDLFGQRLLARALDTAGAPKPRGRDLKLASLAGDLASNSLYYALALGGRPRVFRGLAAGTLGGIASVALAPVVKVGRRPSRVPVSTRVATVAWYAFGGLVAALAASALAKKARA